MTDLTLTSSRGWGISISNDENIIKGYRVFLRLYFLSYNVE